MGGGGGGEGCLSRRPIVCGGGGGGGGVVVWWCDGAMVELKRRAGGRRQRASDTYLKLRAASQDSIAWHGMASSGPIAAVDRNLRGLGCNSKLRVDVRAVDGLTGGRSSCRLCSSCMRRPTRWT